MGSITTKVESCTEQCTPCGTGCSTIELYKLHIREGTVLENSISIELDNMKERHYKELSSIQYPQIAAAAPVLPPHDLLLNYYNENLTVLERHKKEREDLQAQHTTRRIELEKKHVKETRLVTLIKLCRT